MLDAFGTEEDFMGQWLLALVGQRGRGGALCSHRAWQPSVCSFVTALRSVVNNLVCRAGEGCGNGVRQLCQPSIRNQHLPSFLCSRRVGHSYAALHLLHPGTAPGWWDGRHPLLRSPPQFPKCPLISAQLRLRKCGDGLPHLLVGCLHQAKQSRTFALC